MTSRLYRWKDSTSPTYDNWFGFGYECEMVDEDNKILSFFSYSNLDVDEIHTLLFLEECEIEDIIPFKDERKKVLWKMLLVDQNRYKRPTIIYVDPAWIEPLKPNETKIKFIQMENRT